MDSFVKPVSVKVSTIAHATEDYEKVAKAIRNLSVTDTPMRATVNRAKGHHGNEIVTLAFTIRNAKMAESFLQNIWNSLPQIDRTEVYSSIASRTDSSGTLFLRIDKQEAVRGRMRLQNIDPIKIEISFQTKPSRRNEFGGEIRRSLERILRPDSDFV